MKQIMVVIGCLILGCFIFVMMMGDGTGTDKSLMGSSKNAMVKEIENLSD